MTDARVSEAAAGASAASPKQPAAACAQYPARMAVDFTQLRPHALQRYLAFHGVPAPPGSSQADLAVLVARHFGDACARADEAKSIASFVSYVTQDGKAVRDSGPKRRKRTDPPVELGTQHELLVAHEVEVEDVDAFPFEDERPLRRRRCGGEGGDRLAEGFADEDRVGDELDADADESLDPQGAGPKPGHARSSSGSSTARPGEPAKKKKAHRKPRLYCVCKGGSFGDMIACDNKKCLDRSNWYHMTCVGLDPSAPPPDTWFCPLCRGKDMADVPENQYRKPVASVTYGDMISHALTALPDGKGTFKEICDFVEQQYESQLNWKLESDQRKSPVWKSSVRKILFSNMRFRKHPEDKGLFCLAA